MDSCPVSQSSPLSLPINQLSIELLHRLSSSAGTDNVFVSPFSISTCLSMLLLGARGNSQHQLWTGLMFDKMSDNQDKDSVHRLFHELIEGRIRKEGKILLANYVLMQKEEPIIEKFRNDVQSLYSAAVDDVDFASEGPQVMSRVNNWVSENTKGLIDSILTSPPDDDTRLILLNAIYFKGKWKLPFDPELTEKMAFHNNGNQEVETDFMYMYNKRFNYLSDKMSNEAIQVLEMPYTDDATSMVIILPEQKDGLSRILSHDSIRTEMSRILESISQPRDKEVMRLFIPKFKFETEYELNDVLSEMGIIEIFTKNADLSGINGSKNLYVSLVKHKAVVKCDEEGTEAAAVTMAMICLKSAMMGPEPIEFRADHPFIFLIRDTKSGMIYFIGKVEKF